MSTTLICYFIQIQIMQSSAIVYTCEINVPVLAACGKKSALKIAKVTEVTLCE